mmetsp:Transcript_28187/g.39655  ORF Transcript_28187/g.39655 Transcript_28187/m.39655 type:complete len:230 (+) Transcript_28187:179-868(+)
MIVQNISVLQHFGVVKVVQHVALLLALSSSPEVSPPGLEQQQITPVPVLEVIKAYGSLAGNECYGSQAPRGSSCQLPLSYLKDELGFTSSTSSNENSLTSAQFAQRINILNFQWPLKPYGRDKSLSKTATMNKGAETYVFMDELEKRGLYDRRNPTGPLPTSLRPQLNLELNREGIDPKTIDVIFQAFANSGEKLTGTSLDESFHGKETLDYYEFLDLIGSDKIYWPSY